MGRIGRLNDQTIQSMNFDSIKEFWSSLSARDLPTGAAALIGIVLLFFVFKMGRFFMKLMLLLVAAALFGAAYWWHHYK